MKSPGRGDRVIGGPRLSVKLFFFAVSGTLGQNAWCYVPRHSKTFFCDHFSNSAVERAASSLTEAGPAEPLKGMRRAMAQRMALAHAQVVPTTVTDEVDIDAWSKGADITIRLVQAI